MSRSVPQLRRECEETRRDLANTLSSLKLRARSATDDLRHKVSPEGVKSELSAQSRAWGHSLKNYAERYPLQSAAAGIAIAVPAFKFLKNIPAPLMLIGARV